jgi:hypothetical protein
VISEGSVDFEFFLLFAWFYRVSYHLLAFVIFSLFQMTFLIFSWLFGRLVVLHRVLNSNFKLYSVCCQWTHQGGD